MRSKKYTASEQIILSAALRCGYTRGFADVADRCGFNYKTFWQYRKNDNYPLSWIRSMDKALGFTDTELIHLVRDEL